MFGVFTPSQICNSSPALLDLCKLPRSYTHIAEAVVAGVCDQGEDTSSTVFALAEVVDNYIRQHSADSNMGDINIAPSWEDVFSKFDLDSLETDEVLQQQILHIGKLADHVAELWATERATANS